LSKSKPAIWPRAEIGRVEALKLHAYAPLQEILAKLAEVGLELALDRR
jgi:hypothetical protein